jgi:hypothetical protein
LSGVEAALFLANTIRDDADTGGVAEWRELADAPDRAAAEGETAASALVTRFLDRTRLRGNG